MFEYLRAYLEFIHIISICKKASQQLNILKRLDRYLDRLSKLTILISLIKTLINRESKIDPWGTPFWMSDQLLRILLILICCFLFDN
jgi:hypothetical protein